jgi:hypothetical protein
MKRRKKGRTLERDGSGGWRRRSATASRERSISGSAGVGTDRLLVMEPIDARIRIPISFPQDYCWLICVVHVIVGGGETGRRRFTGLENGQNTIFEFGRPAGLVGFLEVFFK